MDASHVIQAHDHIRSASISTLNNNIGTAAAEHEQAATELRKAAKETNDSEALRILALLESHHHQLAHLIKSPASRTAVTNLKDHEAVSETSDTPATPSPAANEAASALSPRSESPIPSTTRAVSRRRPPRDTTSSIASNLATARGIPGAHGRRGPPASPSVSVASAVASARSERASRATEQDSPLKDALQRQVKEAGDRGRSPLSKAQQNPPQPIASTPPDEGFQKFYSTFEPILSAISAPLAFASLPLRGTLTAPQTTAPAASTNKLSRSTTSVTSELDYTKLISKPALRALREDQGPSGPFANAESFYVVPTSGGTVSYAGIVSQQPNTGAHLPDLIEEDTSDRGSAHDEFVDAVEQPYPPSPTSQRHGRKHSRPSSTASSRAIPAGRGQGLKTTEEVQLENDTLRMLLDKQSKRLQMWEAQSQAQSLALAQSFHARGSAPSDPAALAQAIAQGTVPPVPPLPSSPPATSATPGKQLDNAPDPSSESKDDTESKLAELTALIEEHSKTISTLKTDKESLAKENEKQQRLLGKYREQWEKLKAGARKKEKEREEARKAAVVQTNEEAAGAKGGTGDVGDDGVVEDEEAGFGKA